MPVTKLVDIPIRLLNRLVPHHCPICVTQVTDYGLCAACWSRLHFITDPICQICGRPLPESCPTPQLCGACLMASGRKRSAKPLGYQRAIVRYDDASKALVLPFKHASRPDLTALLAGMMQAQFHQLASDETIIMPVPLHITRRLYRRYNQSAELARHLCYKSGRLAQLDVTSLTRRKATRPLARFNKAKRQAILANAFALRAPVDFKGRPILLSDDVMTTGQTYQSIARLLAKSGARKIDCLTFARVVR